MPSRQKLRPLPNPPAADIRGLLRGKVTKANVLAGLGDSKAESKKRKLTEENETSLPQAKRPNTYTPNTSKPSANSRKRKAREEDNESDLPPKKALKDGNESVLLQPLQDIVYLHSCFLKALSLHFAHNGSSVPAELDALLASITRLWKKRNVRKDDVRRLLALYELSTEKSESAEILSSISFKAGKFRLYQFGTGRQRTSLEYVGRDSQCKSTTSTFDEEMLQQSFLQHVKTLHSYSNKLEHLRFLNGSFETFPLIECEVPQQEVAHQARAKQRRSEILRTAKSVQPKPGDFPVALSTPELCSPELNSRKSSLLSRIQARQLAKAGVYQPTAPEVLRSHALGRLEEVVSTLRMMHQLKLKSGRLAKVSFSTEQVEQTIRDSTLVPIGREEVAMCLRILAEEVEVGWVKLVHGLGVGDRKEFVVLEGAGMQGDEARQWIKKLEGTQKDPIRVGSEGAKQTGLGSGLKGLRVK